MCRVFFYHSSSFSELSSFSLSLSFKVFDKFLVDKIDIPYINNNFLLRSLISLPVLFIKFLILLTSILYTRIFLIGCISLFLGLFLI